MKSIFLSVLMFAFILPAASASRPGSHPHPASARHSPVIHQHAPTVRPGPTIHRRTPVKANRVIEGISTWYGPEMKFNGHYNKMANGERFDPEKLTAASLTLPLGSLVRVTNMQTGLTVDVEITDRGPFVKGRILDLAQAAARRIACAGICRVQIAAIPGNEEPAPGGLKAEDEGEPAP